MKNDQDDKEDSKSYSDDFFWEELSDVDVPPAQEKEDKKQDSDEDEILRPRNYTLPPKVVEKRKELS